MIKENCVCGLVYFQLFSWFSRLLWMMICRSCCSLLESVKSVESPDDKWSLLTFTCQHHHHNQDEESMKHCIVSLHPVDTSTPDSMILHYINGFTVSWSLDHAIGKISKWVDWTKIPNSKLPKPVMLEKYWSLDDWEYMWKCDWWCRLR